MFEIIGNEEQHFSSPSTPYRAFGSDNDQNLTVLKVSVDERSSQQVLQCEPCDKAFLTVGPWVKHMQKHKGEAGVHVPDLQQYKGAYKEYTNAQGRNYHHKVISHCS